MRKLAISAALALGAIATAGFAPAQARPARGANPACHRLTPVQLDQQFAEFNASWASKSPDAVAALFDDDAVLLATIASVPRTDPAGIRDYFVKFLKGSPVGRIDTSTIKSGCNWALRMGTWTVIMTALCSPIVSIETWAKALPNSSGWVRAITAQGSCTGAPPMSS